MVSKSGDVRWGFFCFFFKQKLTVRVQIHLHSHQQSPWRIACHPPESCSTYEWSSCWSHERGSSTYYKKDKSELIISTFFIFRAP